MWRLGSESKPTGNGYFGATSRCHFFGYPTGYPTPSGCRIVTPPRWGLRSSIAALSRRKIAATSARTTNLSSARTGSRRMRCTAVLYFLLLPVRSVGDARPQANDRRRARRAPVADRREVPHLRRVGTVSRPPAPPTPCPLAQGTLRHSVSLCTRKKSRQPRWETYRAHKRNPMAMGPACI